MDDKIRKWIIENNRVPQKLLDQVSSISGVLLDKLQKYENTLDGKCIIITGPDTIYKDLTAVYFLLRYAEKNRKILYCSHPNCEFSISYATAIMRIELLKNTFNMPKVLDKLTNIITNGEIFILGCDSVHSIENLFEGSFNKLIIDSSIEFKMPDIESRRITV